MRFALSKVESNGYFTLMDIDNNTLDFRDRGGKQSPLYKLLERLNARKSILCIQNLRK